MNKTEIPRQVNLFTGELEDTRTPKQKEQDKLRTLPQPIEMFSPRDVAQFGITAHPLLPLGEKTKLALIGEDPRTPEDKERDLEREAQRHTLQLFPSEHEPNGVYLSPQRVAPITDPRRLLPAQSVVSPPTSDTLPQAYLRYHAIVARQAAEHLLYWRLLTDHEVAAGLPLTL